MSKDNINLLITGIGGDIGQGIIKCIENNLNYNIIVGCDIDKYAASKSKVDYFFIVPRADNSNEYENSILEICNCYHINYIIPSTESEIKFYDKNKDKFEGINILINSSNILDIFMDKLKTIKFFEQNNIPFPKTFLIDEYKNQINFPLILKPIKSSGSRNIHIINDNTDLEYLKNIVNDAIIQEYIGSKNEEYTMGVFSDGKNVYSISFRRILGYGGLSKFVELVNDDKLTDLAMKIAKLINLKGSINIQLRKKDDEYIPFEVNPRISSTVAFRNKFGFQDVIWWIKIMGINDLIEYQPIYKKGIGVKTVGEVFFDME